MLYYYVLHYCVYYPLYIITREMPYVYFVLIHYVCILELFVLLIPDNICLPFISRM